MAQDQNNNAPAQSDTNSRISSFLNQLGQHLQQSLQPQAQPSAPTPEMMYAPVGNNTVAMPFTPTPISSHEIQNFRANEPGESQGPYTPTPQGEAETSHEYQNRLNSPYMMFGADNRFAQGHPRMAGMMDNAFLGGSLVGQAHAQSLKEGGGVEGAGGAISDVMNGIMGMPQARMKYRQGLEQMPVAYQTAQAQLAEQRAKAAQSEMMGIRAAGQDQATVEAAKQRLAESARVGAAQRQATQELIQKASLLKAQLDSQTKSGIQGQKGKTAVRVANINAAGKVAAANVYSGYRPGSPEDKFFKAQAARRDSALYGKMNGKQQADIRNAIAMKYIQSGGDPIQAKKYAASQLNQWDQGVQNLFGQYSKLPPAEQQAMDFQTFAQKHGVDLNHLSRATQPQAAPTNNSDPLGLGIKP